MSNQSKIYEKLRKGYSPTDYGKVSLTAIYNEVFKPLVKKKKLDIFIELYETDENILKAWGFLGIYHILKNNPVITDEKEERIRLIIAKLLKDESIINYVGGSTEIETSLRVHHISRICELNSILTFKPVKEYFKSSLEKKNDITGELIEKVLSKNREEEVEPLVLKFAEQAETEDFEFKFHILNSFENLNELNLIQYKEKMEEILLSYLEDLKIIKRRLDSQKNYSFSSMINRIKLLHEHILSVAAKLDIMLEEETIEYLKDLKYPFSDLPKIADKYKNNEKFKSILLEKLEETNNPNLIKDILLSIIVLKNNVQDWKELVMNYLKKYQINDGDLIIKLEEENLYDEEMLIKYLNEGQGWQLEFVREFLLYYPTKIEEWKQFRSKIIGILMTFKSSDDSIKEDYNLTRKKELALKLILELELRDLMQYCLENFKYLEENELRKLCLFIMIKFSEEDLLMELKKYLKYNDDANVLFKKVWRELERREGQFYY